MDDTTLRRLLRPDPPEDPAYRSRLGPTAPLPVAVMTQRSSRRLPALAVVLALACLAALVPIMLISSRPSTLLVPSPRTPTVNDGRIAFDEEGDAFVIGVDGTDRRLVSSSAGSVDFAPAWSPDGAWVAYWSGPETADPEYDLVMWSPSEGTSSVLTSGWRSPGVLAWSPDSSTIAFAAEGKNVAGDGDGGAVRIIDVPSGEIRTIPGRYASGLGSDPAWSPDGRRLAYAQARGADAGLYVYELGTATPERLVSAPIDDPVRSRPSWSPDGGRLVYSRRYRADDDIVIVDASNGGETPLVARADEDYLPAWSPDGSRIAFSSGTKTIEFDVVDVVSGTITILAAGGAAGWNDHVTWSPDGTMLIGYRRSGVMKGGGPDQLLVMSGAGGTIVRWDGGSSGVATWGPPGPP